MFDLDLLSNLLRLASPRSEAYPISTLC